MAGKRMAAKDHRQQTIAVLLIEALHQLERGGGVAPGVSHGVEGDAVGFFLVQAHGVEGEVGVIGHAAKERGKAYGRVAGYEHPQPGEKAAVSEGGAVSGAGDDLKGVALAQVGEFVGNDAGEFVFVLYRGEQSQVDSEHPAWCGKSIDAGVGEQDDLQIQIAQAGVAGHLLAELVEIVLEQRGVDENRQVGRFVVEPSSADEFFVFRAEMGEGLAYFRHLVGYCEWRWSDRSEQNQRQQRTDQRRFTFCFAKARHGALFPDIQFYALLAQRRGASVDMVLEIVVAGIDFGCDKVERGGEVKGFEKTIHAQAFGQMAVLVEIEQQHTWVIADIELFGKPRRVGAFACKGDGGGVGGMQAHSPILIQQFADLLLLQQFVHVPAVGAVSLLKKQGQWFVRGWFGEDGVFGKRVIAYRQRDVRSLGGLPLVEGGLHCFDKAVRFAVAVDAR